MVSSAKKERANVDVPVNRAARSTILEKSRVWFDCGWLATAVDIKVVTINAEEIDRVGRSHGRGGCKERP